MHLGLALAGPVCAALEFRPSSPEARDVKRHQRPLLARNGSGLATYTVNYRVLWHAANLRYGANDFTSLLKEGMLRIFSPEKSDGFGREYYPSYSEHGK
jgi:hypothetical protein